MWFHVNSKWILGVDYLIPLELLNLPPTLIMVEEPVDYVTVRAKQKDRFPTQPVGREMAAVLDLSQARPGTRWIELTKGDIRKPSYLEVLKIDPPAVKLNLEAVATKTVAVMPEVSGKPVRGMVVREVEVDPSTVTIFGARSVLSGIKMVTTAPVDLSGAAKSFSLEVPLKSPARSIGIQESRRVMVRVILEEEE